MNRLCLLALLALATGACAKERALSKTPPPKTSKEKKEKKKEAEPSLPMTFLRAKEIKGDKDNVVGTTKEEEARKVVNHFLKDKSKNNIPIKALRKESKNKYQISYRKNS